MDADANEREYTKWVRKMVEANEPLIADSSIFLAILSDNYVRDAVPVLQFGLAVLLNKPIYLVVPKGTPVNDNVRRLARAIEYYTGPEDAPEAVRRVLRTRPRKK